MAKKIFLMFNMGNSGGKWFQDICNVHEDVMVWQEANHQLKVQYESSSVQVDTVYNFFMDQFKNSPKHTVGLIKSFDDRLVKLADQTSGKVVQMFRNPIGVVHFKTGHKMQQCLQKGKFKSLSTPKETFEAHVDFYRDRYVAYTRYSKTWPLIKLEDLKKSLREDKQYFEETMRMCLQVEWKPEHTQRVVAMGGLEEDLSHLKIWQDWEIWKKEIFLEYFKEVMEMHGYKWE